MEGICKGCEEDTYIIEYINDGNNIGNYCSDCMTCNCCGNVLPSDRLAFMQVYTLKGTKARMSVPAKNCAECIRNPKLWKDVEEDVNIFN